MEELYAGCFELIRLRAEIKQAEDLIRKVDAEIDLLQAIYDRMNR